MSLPSELIPESDHLFGSLGGPQIRSNGDLNHNHHHPQHQHQPLSLDASFQFRNSGAESTIFLVEASSPANATSGGTYGSTPLLSRSKGYKVRISDI